MILAGVLLVSALFLLFIESKAVLKRRQINNAIGFALGNDPKEKNKTLIESSALAAGATSLNIYDIYAASEKHEEVLNVIGERYNREIGEDASPLEWHAKVKELFAGGDKSVDNYVSAYAGQAGEISAIEMLEKSGKKAELFPSRTHPDNDIRVYNQDGTHTDYSVKSYQDISDFKSVVQDHPESTHYVVNSEIFEQLKENGDLAKYQEEGIEILNGEFSHELNRQMAEDALIEFHEETGILDDIPFLALGLFGVKTIKNIVDNSKQVQSNYETSVNVLGDLSRLGTMAIVATEIAEIGGLIGTAIAPGIGTLIGSGMGALVGAMGGAKLINLAKERIKWGKIIDSIDVIGKAYNQQLRDKIKDNLKNNVFSLEKIKSSLNDENELRKKYNKSISPYEYSNVTLPGVLTHMHSKMLETRIEQIEQAPDLFEKELYKLCNKASKMMSKDDEKRRQLIRTRLIGELLASNSDTLLDDNFPKVLEKSLNDYKEQIKIAPNHPYKFSQPSDQVLQGLAMNAYNNWGKNIDVGFNLFNPIMIISIFMLALSSLYIMLPYLSNYPQIIQSMKIYLLNL